MARRRMDIPWTDLLAAVLLYAVALVYQGYQYGQEDQSQILPCLYAQDHPGAYAQDHYVQHYLRSRINERSVFHFLFRCAGYDNTWIVWIWHAAFSMALLLAWIKIAGIGIHQKIYQYFTVLLLVTAAHHTSVGGNELYYNTFIPSLAAKALASWGLLWWLREKYMGWALAVAIAGWLQPLAGLQVFIFTGLAMMIYWVANWKTKILPWKSFILYLVLTFPWIYLLADHNGGHRQQGAFMDIMEFRLAHHFFPGEFGAAHLFIFAALALIALRFFRQRIRWCILLILAGCVMYTVGVEKYRIPLVLYSQWWKTTIWLEAFAFVAIGVGLERLHTLPGIWRKLRLIVPFIGVAAMVAGKATGYIGHKPAKMYPWQDHVTAEVDISLKAQELTPENAVFIVPAGMTAFRWYSKRSLYVDYKAMLHREDFLTGWYRRVQQIYAYSLEEKQAGFDLYRFSRTILDYPSPISIEVWKKLGITHIISQNPAVTQLTLVGGNGDYFIYSLE